MTRYLVYEVVTTHIRTLRSFDVALELTIDGAFTSRPFGGNPAAVAILDAFLDDDYMQSVAREMNLSETAFAKRTDGDHDLRWFTPKVGVDLCGHATLAAVHVLGGMTRFHTRAGILDCWLDGDGWISMDFPGDMPEELPAPSTLENLVPRWCGVGQRPGSRYLLVEIGSAAAVRCWEPDMSAVTALDWSLVITAPGDRRGIDCVSRVFAPKFGVPEDPVTRSAHCVLAPFWANLLGRASLIGEQASIRGGVVRMHIKGGRVKLAGQAVTTGHVQVVR